MLAGSHYPRMVEQATGRGFGLIETLVAMALLGMALSGLVQAQWQARALLTESLRRQQTILLLADLAARLRLNPSAASDYRALLQAGLSPDATVDGCVAAACAPAERARADVRHFASELRRVLPMPSWRLDACLDSPGDCLLVAWAGTEPSSGPDGACLDAAGLRHAHAHCLAMELP